MEPLLNTREASRLLGVAEITVRKWVAKGYLPHVKLGRRVLFRKKLLEVFVDEHSKIYSPPLSTNETLNDIRE